MTPIVLKSVAEAQGESSEEFASFGSGTAVPAGIEAILEYNGLYLNNRETIEKYRISEIDGLHDADIRDSREVNPSWHGETALDAYYGGRTITLTGRIEAFTLGKMRDMQQALRLAFGELEEKPLIFRTANSLNDHYIECRKVQSIAMRESQSDQRYFRDFQITLRASNPRIVAQYYKSIAIDALDTPVSAVNAGNFLAQPILQIDGPITNPIARYRPPLGDPSELKLNGTLVTNETITVDIANRTIRDQTGANRFDLLAFDTDWPEIEPGDFSFELDGSGDGVNTQLLVIWRDTWL